MNKLAERNAQPPNQRAAVIGMSQRDMANYDLGKALRAVAFGPKDPKYIREAAFELECSEAAEKREGRAARGILLPHDMLVQRTLTAGTATDGAELVAENLLAGSFVDVLRNQSATLSMGATMLNGLVGDVKIPRKTSGATAAWIGTEGGDAANSEAQFDQISLVPKTSGVYSDITRQLLLQGTPSIQQIVMNDIAIGMVTTIDCAALYGSGASGQPLGIANQTGINAPTAFAAATPTWAEVVGMESSVAVDNALRGSLGYIIPPAMCGSLKTSPKITGYPTFIMDNNDRLNGYKCNVTNQVNSGDVFFGAWQDLVIGFWGGLDILVDPYTNSLSGTVRIVAHQSCDIAVRHPVSFAFNNDGA